MRVCGCGREAMFGSRKYCRVCRRASMRPERKRRGSGLTPAQREAFNQARDRNIERRLERALARLRDQRRRTS